MRRRFLLGWVLLALCTAPLATGCGEDVGPSDGGGVRRDGASTMDGGGMGDGSFSRDIVAVEVADRDARINYDAFFAMDPPPQMCLPDGGRVAIDAGTITGTVDCPSDRNREGCPCDTLGMTAPCWPGLRVNRNRGQCHDGMTTCVGDEIGRWGPCMGAVLPTPGATRGPGACNCFSSGTWNIPNIAPCFLFRDMARTQIWGANSTIGTGMCDNAAHTCGTSSCMVTMPTMYWSTNTLQVDCGGRFHLCVRLRAFPSTTAFMSHTTSATDCTMAESCTDVTVPPIAPGSMAPTVTPPPLPAWYTSTPAQVACAQTFATNSGYAEFTVVGLSSECQDFNDGAGGPLVFNRILYCPLLCADPANAGRPECMGCGNGASGMF